MKILGKKFRSEVVELGRLSDGSDRQVVTVATYTVTVDFDNRTYELTFDHDPTEQEIQTAFAGGLAEEFTTLEDLARKLADTRARLKAAEEDNINVMLALVEVYETMLGV